MSRPHVSLSELSYPFSPQSGRAIERRTFNNFATLKVALIFIGHLKRGNNGPLCSPNAFYRDFDNLTSFCDETRKVIPLFYLCFWTHFSVSREFRKDCCTDQSCQDYTWTLPTFWGKILLPFSLFSYYSLGIEFLPLLEN